MNRVASVMGRCPIALVIALIGCRFSHGEITFDAPCADRDHDSICDDEDSCPDDPAKAAPGVCGCSIPDVDADHDGFPDCLGCADGERDGFTRVLDYPDIAACAGGWTNPGVMAIAGTCNRRAGDDSDNPTGTGCSTADLCQSGWHVCASAADVAASSPAGCADASDDAGTSLVFYATGQSGPGSLLCMATGSNDLFGCGTVGVMPDVSCLPLTRSSNNLCTSLPLPWSCGTDGYAEAINVTKPGSDAGGVLCCRTP